MNHRIGRIALIFMALMNIFVQIVQLVLNSDLEKHEVVKINHLQSYRLFFSATSHHILVTNMVVPPSPFFSPCQALSPTPNRSFVTYSPELCHLLSFSLLFVDRLWSQNHHHQSTHLLLPSKPLNLFQDLIKLIFQTTAFKGYFE